MSFQSNAVAETDQMSLKSLVAMLLRRKVMIGVITLIGTLISILVVFQVTPQFQATAYLTIDARKSRVMNADDVLSGMNVDSMTIETEAAVLRSRQLAAKVIEKLDLYADKEFNPRLSQGQGGFSLNPMNWLPPEWRRVVAGQPAEDEADPRSRELAGIIDSLGAAVSVYTVPRSYVIAIQVRSNSASKAAVIANTFSDFYVFDQLEAKFEATKMAASWLNSRLGELRQNVIDAERATEAYRAQSGLVEGRGGSVNAQQLSELSSQLILVRADRSEREARLRQVRTLVSQGGGIENSNDVLQSPLIQRLREQEAQVQRKLSELAASYGDRHPKIINTEAELRDLRRKTNEEVQKIAGALANEVEVVRAREASLTSNITKLQQDIGQSSQAVVKLRQLEREAESARLIYESFLNRFKETKEQADIQRPDARVISKADVPDVPVFPKKRFIVLMSLFASMVFGIVASAMLEALDNGVRSAEQIEALGGSSVLAMIPAIKAEFPERELVRNPQSQISEAFRTLRASLMLSDVDNVPKTILVTSSIPSEGKTFTSVGLAQVAAMSGMRVLLIDADIRRPRGHKVLKVSSKEGLVQALSGEKKLSELIIRDPDTGLYFLPAGSRAANPMDLLRSQHMEQLIQHVKSQFDMVILDSPPTLAVSDSRILSRMVDKVLFVTRWEKVPRQVVGSALKLLRSVDAPIAGCVLCLVNVRRHAHYGYGDYGYYYGRYQEYYGEKA